MLHDTGLDTMCRDVPGSPMPLFDIPEFPTLRRMRPLPQRTGLPVLPVPTLLDPLAYYDPDEGRGQGADDGGEDADLMLQPGNTKKRKVPGVPGGRERDGASSGEDDGEAGEKGRPNGKLDRDLLEPASQDKAGSKAGKKSRVSAATKAGLQHKDMLKNRKRQLAAVISALSQSPGDTLALDQALTYLAGTAPGPDLKNGGGAATAEPRVRLSRRPYVRRARAARILKDVQVRGPNALPFPTCAFTFVSPCPTSERLAATKQEVAQLRERFEAELDRQAAHAAKAAALAKLAASVSTKGRRGKRADRDRPRAGRKSDEVSSDLLLEPPPKGRGKKKKRSALANASNPHHLRNYVPSRLPGHSTPANPSQAALNAANYIGPPPLRFLSADIPPRRHKAGADPTPASQLTNPLDEWICPFCEYKLFYSDDDAAYRRSIKSRKKILRRRRRARERAAAAANGTSTAKGPKETDTGYEDSYDGYTGGSDDTGSRLGANLKSRNDADGGRKAQGGGEHHGFG